MRSQSEANASKLPPMSQRQCDIHICFLQRLNASHHKRANMTMPCHAWANKPAVMPIVVGSDAAHTPSQLLN